MNKFVLSRWFVIATTIALGLSVSNLAHAQTRRPNYSNYNRQRTQAAINQTQAQLTAAQQLLAAATAEVTEWQGKVSAAQGSLDIASDEFKSSRSEADTSSQRVRELEKQLEEQQPKGSPFVVAKADFLKAKDALDAAANAVFNSEEYKNKYKQALQSADKATVLPKLKDESLKKDLVWQRAKIVFDAVHSQYEQAQHAVYEKNEEWVEATKSVRESRGQQTKAEQRASNAAMHKASANTKLRDATKVQTAAQANVMQLTATLNSLRGSIGQKPIDPTASTASKKK